MKYLRTASLLSLAAFAPQGFLTACASDRDLQSEGAAPSFGDVTLALALDSVTHLTTLRYEITGSDYFANGEIDVSDKADIHHVLPQIPAGKHHIAISGEASDGSATCSGSSDFNVKVHATTSVDVNLRCRLAQNTGTLLVNGTLNTCPRIVSAAALSDSFFVGESIQLTADAVDPDSGPESLTYKWTASSGTLSDPNSAHPSYTRDSAGSTRLTVTVSDGDCSDSWDLDVQATVAQDAAAAAGPNVEWGSTPAAKAVTLSPGTFEFSCDSEPCSYVCSLNDGEFGSCESPHVLPRLPAGDYELRVKARTQGETVEGPVESYRWNVARPNILALIADDLGASDTGPFGSEIETPNLDALAAEGRLLTNHHVGTVCAITRSMLISGTDHHLVGEGTMGAPNDERRGLPGYEGYLNDRALSVAQLLKDGGYHTYIAGKWHLGSRLVDGASGSGKTADQWGFERSFTVLGGGVGNHFLHESPTSTAFTQDGAYARPGQPGYPSGFDADVYTDQLIQNIDSNLTDGKPFFAYAAYTSPHWPLQAPPAWLDKYKGKYDQGYHPIAAARLQRLRASGLLDESLAPSAGLPESLTRSPATPGNGTPSAKYVSAVNGADDGYIDYSQGPVVKNWESLTALEQKSQARYMEIYAAMVSHLDENVGRLLQHLKDIGEYDRTFIIFHSDNGAESWPINGPADPKSIDESNASDATYPTLGTDNGTANARNLKIGIRWAEVGALPYDQFKGFQGEGGLIAPAIVRVPGQKAALPPIEHLTHITDDTATFLDLADVPQPSEPAPADVDPVTGVDRNLNQVLYNGRSVHPVTGISFLPALQQAEPPPIRTSPLAGESYGRAFIYSADGKWKARWTEPPYGPVDGHWELFAIREDRGEENDLAQEYPEIVVELVDAWEDYMTRVGGVEPKRPLGYY